jgi:3-oxoacyl-[acyl-carrier-protein] synthase II
MPVPDRNEHGLAVVAVDAWTALGRDLEETWTAVLAGRSAVTPVEGFDASGFGDTHAAQIWSSPAEPEDDPVQRILGRHGQLVDAVLKRVHEAADVARVARDRVGLYVSTGLSDTPIGDLAPAVLAARGEDGRLELARFFKGAFRRLHPLWPLATLQNVAIGQTSIDLDVRGDNVVLSAEGDGAARTLIEAAHAVADGEADAVLAGAGSESVSPAQLARMRLRGDLGRGPASPGARDGDGPSPGEAAAALVLAADGALDGSAPRARLLGGATAFERATDRPGPTEDAFRRAIAEALGATGVEDVDAVFLHAEGLAALDRAEIRAVNAVLGEAPAIVATKGALGHAGGAAPAVDLALAVRAIEASVLPPTVVRNETLEELGSRLTAEAVERHVRRVH